MHLVQISNFLLSSTGAGEEINPGEVVIEHLADKVINSGPIGYLNTHFFDKKIFGIFDMKITGVVLMMWIAVLLCLLVFVPLSRRVRKADKGSSSRWVNM